MKSLPSLSPLISRILHAPVNGSFAAFALISACFLGLAAFRYAPGDRRAENMVLTRSSSALPNRVPPRPALDGGVVTPLGEYYVGVYVETVDPALAAQLKIEGGLVVRYVVPGSPAESKGVKPNDVILSAGETPLLVVCTLGSVVNKAGATEVPFALIREGEPLSLSMIPANRPTDCWVPPNSETVATVAPSTPVSRDATRSALESLEKQLDEARKEVEALKAQLAAKSTP